MDKKKTLYIHLGFVKTGTTAVQHFCHDNRELLLSRYNLYYPRTGCDNYPHNHGPLFPVVHATQWREARWRTLREEVAGRAHADIILSYEGILESFLRHPEECDLWGDRIKEYLPNYTIKFILYIRRLDDWAKSFYDQIIKKYPW